MRSIIQDSQGRLWFATFGGISCYDGARFDTYTVADGLAANEVWSLLIDTSGRLWTGTYTGLCRLEGLNALYRTREWMAYRYPTPPADIP